MTAHTPGPWIVDECDVASDTSPPDDWTAIGTADEDGLASIVAYCHPDNAPVLAAAPDLLTACKRLLAYCHDSCGRTPGYTHSVETCSICNAGAAISKAEGK